MAATSYIPPKDADFDLWLDNFQTLIAATPVDYGLIAADALIITASYNAFHTAFLLATNPATRTSPVIADKDAQRIAAEATVRPYAQRISKNSGIDPSLITGLGLNLPNPTRPPIPAPLTAPALILVSGSFLLHRLAYKDSNLGGTKKKPSGSIGLEIWRSVGTVAATDPAQCKYVETWTKSPNVSTFVAGEQGKVCTYFARYNTKAGPGGKAQIGPWSDPLVATVM